MDDSAISVACHRLQNFVSQIPVWNNITVGVQQTLITHCHTYSLNITLSFTSSRVTTFAIWAQQNKQSPPHVQKRSRNIRWDQMKSVTLKNVNLVSEGIARHHVINIENMFDINCFMWQGDILEINSEIQPLLNSAAYTCGLDRVKSMWIFSLSASCQLSIFKI